MNEHMKNLIDESAMEEINSLDALAVYTYLQWFFLVEKKEIFTENHEKQMCIKFNISRNKARRALDYLHKLALI